MTIHEALETLLDNVENGMIDVEEVKIVFAELEREPCEDAIIRRGYCKDCKYFEYDSVAKVEGIPLIVAHEICSKWGDGCKNQRRWVLFLV